MGARSRRGSRGSLPPPGRKAYGSARVSRPDLLALTPESIASLANLGLVKRAQREIAAGEGPALAEDAAGVVTGTFKDGVIARLVPGLSLRETPCSCGAVTVCRHRVAVALAYPSFHAALAAEPAEPAPSVFKEASEASPVLTDAAPEPRSKAGSKGGEPPQDAPWSPAELTDEELERHLGRRVIERAQGAAAAGIIIEIRPAEAAEVSSARLPTCAVRFLVPRDLAYARCDCALAERCEHIALAAWAFREAARAGAPLARKTIELGAARPSALARPLESALALAREVLIEGVASIRVPHLAPRFALARSELGAASLVWPAGILDELELSLEAYRDRSARYSSALVASLITELAARARAAARPGELPARFILGADEARETLLDHVRLVSLGARVFADGREREAEVYLADPGSGVVLVLRRRFGSPENEAPDDGPKLAGRNIASRISLASLAGGQIVSRSLRRLANRAVELRARGGQSSVTPHGGDFTVLPASLLVSDLAAFDEARRAAPPRMLRSRVLAEAMRAVEVATVGSIYYRPGEQELWAELHLPRGGSILLVKRHAGVTAGAIDAIAAALTGEPPVRFVSGEIRRGRRGLELDPAALVTDRVIVPDLEAPRPVGLAFPPPPPEPAAPLDEAAAQASGILEEACHIGLARVTQAWSDRASEAAARLEQVGLRELSGMLSRLVDRVTELRRDRSIGEAAAAAWIAVSIRLALLREAL